MKTSAPAGALNSKKTLVDVLKSNIGFFYILPWLIGFLVFKLYPFGSSLIYSFSDFNLHKGITEWGLMNYQEAFTSSKITTDLSTTFKYAFITVPLKLAFALFIAYILNFKIKGVNFSARHTISRPFWAAVVYMGSLSCVPSIFPLPFSPKRLPASLSQAAYRSFRRKRQNSLAPLLLLSPQSHMALRGPRQ